MMISLEQIKAARVMLNWTQDELAKACGLSHNTIHSIENGHQSPRSIMTVKKMFEEKGFEFFGKNGLIRRTDDYRTYTGAGATDQFFEDLLRATQEKPSEIYAICKTFTLLMTALGIVDLKKSDRLEPLLKKTTIKCLVEDGRDVIEAIPGIHVRELTQAIASPWSSITYADRTALIIKNAGPDFTYFIIRSNEVARKNILDLDSRWTTSNYRPNYNDKHARLA